MKFHLHGRYPSMKEALEATGIHPPPAVTMALGAAIDPDELSICETSTGLVAYTGHKLIVLVWDPELQNPETVTIEEAPLTAISTLRFDLDAQFLLELWNREGNRSFLARTMILGTATITFRQDWPQLQPLEIELPGPDDANLTFVDGLRSRI